VQNGEAIPGGIVLRGAGIPHFCVELFVEPWNWNFVSWYDAVWQLWDIDKVYFNLRKRRII